MHPYLEQFAKCSVEFAKIEIILGVKRLEVVPIPPSLDQGQSRFGLKCTRGHRSMEWSIQGQISPLPDVAGSHTPLHVYLYICFLRYSKPFVRMAFYPTLSLWKTDITPDEREKLVKASKTRGDLEPGDSFLAREIRNGGFDDDQNSLDLPIEEIVLFTSMFTQWVLGGDDPRSKTLMDMTRPPVV